jgi:hypothetical protein
VLFCACPSIETPGGPDKRGDDGANYGGALSLDGATPSVDEATAPPWTGSADDASADVVADDAVADANGMADATWIPPPPLPPFDPGEGGICARALAPGDIVIDELMIESVAGTGDHGEWLEAKSTVTCAIDLRGLHGIAPSGSKVRTFEIGDDIWIPAGGTFVVADSSNAALNHNLPGTVVVWSGEPGDVLRNKGGTVTVLYGGQIIDSVTYPSMPLTIGASLSFPSDCASARRSDWTVWQASTSSWYPGFYGTPNAPNDDVKCF